jgi:hypothetical protein
MLPLPAKSKPRQLRCAPSPDVRQWIDASSRFWTHREDAQKYAEAFRLAGLK